MQEKTTASRTRRPKTDAYLLNAPWKDPENPLLFGVRAGSRWPHFQKIKAPGALPNYIPFPHFLATAAAVLENGGFCVRLCDAVAQDMDEERLMADVGESGPGLVLMEVSTPSLENDLRIAGRIKELIPETKLALAGPHEPMYEEAFLDAAPVVDFVLCGEYEETLLELCTELKKDSPDFGAVKGLVFRAQDGRAKATQRRPVVEDLDRLPAYSCANLPMERYNDRPCGLPGPSLQMWTSRGCPFGCTFCQWPQIMYAGRRWRTLSTAETVRRSAALVKQYNLKSVYFDDDTFNVNRDRCLEFCRLMPEAMPGLPWAIMARVDLMDEELLKAFAASGLFSLKYGIETADPDVQKSCGKNIDLQHAARMIDLTKKLGIRVQLTFTFGFPEDDHKSIERTTDFACAMAPDYAQFSILTPFPGTKLYNELKARGYIEDRGFAGFNASTTAVMRTDHLSCAELEKCLAQARDRFFEQQRKRDK